MSQNSSTPAAQPSTDKVPAEKLVRDIHRATRKHHSAKDKIRIVLEGLRGEESKAALCRREAIAESLYYAWSKEFLEAGKRRLAGDTARAATTDEVMGDRLLEPFAMVSLNTDQQQPSPGPGCANGFRPASTTYVWVVALSTATVSMVLCKTLLC